MRRCPAGANRRVARRALRRCPARRCATLNGSKRSAACRAPSSRPAPTAAKPSCATTRSSRAGSQDNWREGPRLLLLLQIAELLDCLGVPVEEFETDPVTEARLRELDRRPGDTGAAAQRLVDFAH